MSNDGAVTPHPYIAHAIKGIVQKLVSAGHNVLSFTPYKHKESWDDILLPLYFPDGGLDIRNALEAGKEPMLPSAKRLIDDPVVRNLSHHELWKYPNATSAYCNPSYFTSDNLGLGLHRCDYPYTDYKHQIATPLAGNIILARSSPDLECEITSSYLL
ncbi:hypothetical protein BHE90_010126 [Fusarium euwallaceae]|uniref:Uncharacterized protein n=1 Tax=Fusarium euwallaceae TaxID=1147111 RepID=A0A430LIB8_9HYPO|nr:hypothetical protein BHE90_010126 [Fusarium euwallaceae]